MDPKGRKTQNTEKRLQPRPLTPDVVIESMEEDLSAPRKRIGQLQLPQNCQPRIVIEGKAKTNVNTHLDQITPGDYRLEVNANSTVVYTENMVDYETVP